MNRELEDLMAMGRDGLAIEWQKLFGRPPPYKCGEELMRQVLGWHLQAKRSGGLTRKELRRLMDSEHTPSCSIAPGTSLIRVWQNRTHQVRVLENGFHYDGKTWKSLSSIARHITGTSWSGPAFFAIRKPS